MEGRRLRVLFDNRLRVDLAEAVAMLAASGVQSLREAFEHRNPTWYKLKAMGYYPPKHEPQEIVTWAQEGGQLTFPRGGAERLRVAAEAVGVSLVWRDERVSGTLDASGLSHNVVLWPHQERIVAAVVRKQNCLVRSATASGKTTACLAIAAKLGLPTLVILWTGGLFEQWRKRVQKELGVEPGVLRASRRVLRPVTIAMLQTLDKRGVDDELKRTFGCVIFDEIQRAPSTSAYKILDAFPAKYRVGVSDNEKRADGKEATTYDLLGEVAVEVTSKEIEDTGAAMPVEVRAVPTRFKADWLRAEASFELIDMRSGDPGADANRLLDEMIDDQDREALIHRVVRDEVADGAQVLVLTRRVRHAEQVRDALAAEGIAGKLMIGSDGKRERKREFEAAVAEFEDGTLKVGVGTVQAVGVGQDLPTVEAGVLALPIGWKKPYGFRQFRGRICRKPAGKRRARLYVLVDLDVFGTSVLRTLERWNDGDVVVLDDSLPGVDQWVSVSDYLRSRSLRLREQDAGP
jgi:superfamily II DNA or RNA helicase